MYHFNATYYNFDNEAETIKEIIFNGQHFSNERDAYIYAMKKAYNIKEKNEMLIRLDFIAY